MEQLIKQQQHDLHHLQISLCAPYLHQTQAQHALDCTISDLLTSNLLQRQIVGPLATSVQCPWQSVQCHWPHFGVLSAPWLQDGAASDSLDAAMRLVHLNALLRQGVKLIRGVDLGIGESHFQFQVFSAIPIFKVRKMLQLPGWHVASSAVYNSGCGSMGKSRILLVAGQRDLVAGADGLLLCPICDGSCCSRPCRQMLGAPHFC